MQSVLSQLESLQGREGYPYIYLILMSCGMGAPFNSDLILITLSILSALGYFNLNELIPLAFFALLTGDTVNFFIARAYGRKLLSFAPFRWIITAQKLDRAQDAFQKRGENLVFFIRFLPLIRTVLFFCAGTLKVSIRKFYLLNVASTIIYLNLLMRMTHHFGKNREQVFEWLSHAQKGILILFSVLLIALITFQAKKKKRKSTS